MIKFNLRKKLTTTIASVLGTILATWLASTGFDLSPEQQLTLVEVAGAIIGAIIVSFNIGQGIADKGKEALLVLPDEPKL